MPKWKEGFRRLSDDLKTLRAWVWAVAAGISILIALAWVWWAHWTGMPAPVLVLGAFAMLTMALIAAYLLTLACHYYFGAPTANPRQLSALFWQSDDSVRRNSDGQEPLTLTIRSNPQPQLAVAPERVPANEFRIEPRERHGNLYICLENEKAEPKTGISLRVVSAEYYSAKLEGGRGGFVPMDVTEHGPIRLKPLPNKGKGSLLHDKPHWYELIRVGTDCALVDLKAGKQHVLKATRHRFQIEFRWQDYVSVLPLEIDVVADGNGKRVAVVSAAET